MSSAEKIEVKEDKYQESTKVGIGAYITLIVAILFFSGAFYKVAGFEWLGAFDFTTLGGHFGTMKDGADSTFLGKGGEGAKLGFLFALSLAPTLMLALGVLEIFTHYGAIRAAQRLLTPLLRPILGVPGKTGLALITDLQSTDAGAALTKQLYEEKEISKKELIVMSSWQYSGAGLINNYFASGPAFFAIMTCSVALPIIVMFVLKFVGAFVARMVLNSVYKKDFERVE